MALAIAMALALAWLPLRAQAQAGSTTGAGAVETPLQEIAIAASALVRSAPLPPWADLAAVPPAVPARRALAVRLDETHLRIADTPLELHHIVRQVNGRRIDNVRDLAEAVGVAAAVWQVTIERNGQQVTATFRT